MDACLSRLITPLSVSAVRSRASPYGGGTWLNRELIAAIAVEHQWPGYPVHRSIGTVTTEQMQASLDMEFGGMNDVLAGLYQGGEELFQNPAPMVRILDPAIVMAAIEPGGSLERSDRLRRQPRRRRAPAAACGLSGGGGRRRCPGRSR